MTGLGVHPLPQKPFVLHLLANKPTRDADFLRPYNYLHVAHKFEGPSTLTPVLLTSKTLVLSAESVCLPLVVRSAAA